MLTEEHKTDAQSSCKGTGSALSATMVFGRRSRLGVRFMLPAAAKRSDDNSKRGLPVKQALAHSSLCLGACAGHILLLAELDRTSSG
jgi:hypothetical protein